MAEKGFGDLLNGLEKKGTSFKTKEHNDMKVDQDLKLVQQMLQGSKGNTVQIYIAENMVVGGKDSEAKCLKESMLHDKKGKEPLLLGEESRVQERLLEPDKGNPKHANIRIGDIYGEELLDVIDDEVLWKVVSSFPNSSNRLHLVFEAIVRICHKKFDGNKDDMINFLGISGHTLHRYGRRMNLLFRNRADTRTTKKRRKRKHYEDIIGGDY